MDLVTCVSCGMPTKDTRRIKTEVAMCDGCLSSTLDGLVRKCDDPEWVRRARARLAGWRFDVGTATWVRGS